jgi:hypothetical protein
MNLRSQNKVKAEIFTSAMNDIMFFLMLFFIIVSTLLSPNVVKLNLPKAENTQSIHKKKIAAAGRGKRGSQRAASRWSALKRKSPPPFPPCFGHGNDGKP